MQDSREWSRKGEDGMSGKRILLSGVVLTLLSLGVVRGQSPSGPYLTPPPYTDRSLLSNDPMPGPPPPPPQSDKVDGAMPQPGLFLPSEWILYPRAPGCACQLGGHGPISWEVYFETGMSVPFGGNLFGRALGLGFDVGGGARTFFYDSAAVDAAWVVDLGLHAIKNGIQDDGHQYALFNVRNRDTTSSGEIPSFPEVDVTLKGISRTYLRLGLGREWWILGSGEGNAAGVHWHWGVDVGGQYGWIKLNVNELPHLTGNLGNVYSGVHTDIDIPFGPGCIVLGAKATCGYTFSDVLQHQNNSDILEANFLLTFGYRW